MIIFEHFLCIKKRGKEEEIDQEKNFMSHIFIIIIIS